MKTTRSIIVTGLVLVTACVPPGPTPGGFVGPQPYAQGAAGAPPVGPADPYAAPEPGAATGPAMAAPGGLDRIRFAAPAGWTTERADGHVTIAGQGCAFHVLAPFQANGDLEATLDATFWKFFAGFGLMNGTTYDVVATGTSAAGWSYRRVEAQVRSTTAHDQYFNALGFAADLGGEMVIVLGMNQLAGTCFRDRWGEMFHGLAFEGHADRPDAFHDAIIGVWQSMSGGSFLEYVFAGNGRYASDAGYTRDSRVSSTEILRTTRTFAGNGSWTLSGRELVMTHDRSPPEAMQIRIEQQWERVNGRTQEVMYRLQPGAGGTRFEAGLTRVTR